MSDGLDELSKPININSESLWKKHKEKYRSNVSHYEFEAIVSAVMGAANYTKQESITHGQRADLIFHMNAAFAHKQQELSGFSNWAFKSMEAALSALEKAGYKITRIEKPTPKE